MVDIVQLSFEIQEDIRSGLLSFQEIAKKHNVPKYVVNDIWDEMKHQEK